MRGRGGRALLNQKRYIQRKDTDNNDSGGGSNGDGESDKDDDSQIGEEKNDVHSPVKHIL